MDRDTIDSNGLIERIEPIRVWRPVALSGRGPLDGVISFDARIGWLVEQHMRATAQHGGRELRVVSGFLDAFSFGDAIEDRRDIDRFCRDYRIERNSTLVVETIAWQTLRPVIMPEGDALPARGVFGRREYALPAADWFLDEAAAWALTTREERAAPALAPIRDSRLRRRDEDLAVINRATIFNSSWDATANAAALDRYRALIASMKAGCFDRLEPAAPLLPAPSA